MQRHTRWKVGACTNDMCRAHIYQLDGWYIIGNKHRHHFLWAFEGPCASQIRTWAVVPGIKPKVIYSLYKRRVLGMNNTLAKEPPTVHMGILGNKVGDCDD